MANDLNRAEFIGNLGDAPEIRYLPSGDPVANFSIACNRQWKDRDTGQKKEQVEWVNLVVFGGLVKVCEDYLGKGHRVFVAGRMRTRSWEKDGHRHYMTEIVVRELQMLGSPSTGRANRQPDHAPDGKTPPTAPGLDDDLDSDIPF
ncbi:single-stranded DNA-binding protein [Salinisphaera sp. T31B1]|uniref:single-stranded DNA-binding protein n=1 Tax=Salinisphaera sp. T31B1 TaxID=727963 RepID=UPI0033421846